MPVWPGMIFAPLILSACLFQGDAPALASGAPEPATPPSARYILEQALLHQRGLQNFAADVTFVPRVWGQALPALHFRLYSQRPNHVAIQWGDARPQPVDSGLLLPYPEQLLAGPYRLSAGTGTTLSGARAWTVQADSCDPGHYNLRLWVDPRNWLIVQALIEKPGSPDDHLLLAARYRRMAADCWVPQTLEGRGVLLLDPILPALLRSAGRALLRGDRLQFTAALSGHQVNLASSVFVGSGARPQRPGKGSAAAADGAGPAP